MSFFQNKKRKGTFSQNGPSSKVTRYDFLPAAAPAPNNPKFIAISQIIEQQCDQYFKEIIEDLKSQIQQLKADLTETKRKLSRVEDQAIPAYRQSTYEKWDTSPSYIN